MTFGEYIRARRKSLHLRQADLKGFSQAYISDIENGDNNPTLRETIEKLAKQLQLPENRVDWLQAYVLFDKNPDEYFGRQFSANGIRESGNTYHATPELSVGATPADVINLLGKPSKELRFGAQMWWSYASIGVKIVFKHDRVAAVEDI